MARVKYFKMARVVWWCAFDLAVASGALQFESRLISGPLSITQSTTGISTELALEVDGVAGQVQVMPPTVRVSGRFVTPSCGRFRTASGSDGFGDFIQLTRSCMVNYSSIAFPIQFKFHSRLSEYALRSGPLGVRHGSRPTSLREPGALGTSSIAPNLRLVNLPRGLLSV